MSQFFIYLYFKSFKSTSDRRDGGVHMGDRNSFTHGKGSYWDL